MITSLPAVQHSCKDGFRIIHKRAKVAKFCKANANRRHRRALNRATHRMMRDPERFYDETFNAPSYSSWDVC